MDLDRMGRNNAVIRWVVAFLAGLIVGITSWFVLKTYFPDVPPFWGTAVGAAVLGLLMPIPGVKRKKRNESIPPEDV
jgi:drug/metabolite transporter (DMT)-like permease